MSQISNRLNDLERRYAAALVQGRVVSEMPMIMREFFEQLADAGKETGQPIASLD